MSSFVAMWLMTCSTIAPTSARVIFFGFFVRVDMDVKYTTVGVPHGYSKGSARELEVV